MQKPHKRTNRVMVFGVFDLLHEGHRKFLVAAGSHGGKLIVEVARDEVVRMLKNKSPRWSEKERVAALRQSKFVDRVVLGDKVQGTYGVIRRCKPHIICLGYDQNVLAKDLASRMASGQIPLIKFVYLLAY